MKGQGIKMFGKELIVELKKHRLFEFYWNDEMEDFLDGEVVLNYEPTEYIGYYKVIKEIELSFKGNIDELKNSVARLSLIYTSSEECFNIDNAMEKSKCNSVLSAINAKVEIYDKKEKILVYTFRLWSGKPEKIESDTKTIKLLLGAM